MFKDRAYFTTLPRIALPIITQNFLTSLLNLVDVAMLGQLGDTVVASVGQANQIFFLLTLMLFGNYSGMAVFNAQLWGKRDVTSIRKVMGIGLVTGLGISGLFTLLALLIPNRLINLFTNDPAVIASGASYLRIVGWSYMMMATTFAFSSALRSTGFVRVPMVVSSVALGLKTLMNYGLILGHFGLPAMGVEGAAISTVVARLVELLGMLAVVYWRKLPPAARIRELLGFNRQFLGRVLTTSLPVLINETLWALGINIYNTVYGHIGTDAYAAISISGSIENLAFVIFMGVSDATGIMIGHRIGEDEEDKAFDYARQTLALSTAGAILVGLSVYFNVDLILSIYKLSPASMEAAHNILRVVGLAMWVRTSNMIIIVGVLRAGGDTRFSMFLDAGSIWLVGVPLAIIGGMVLHQPVYVVYMMVMAEEAVKYLVGLYRVFSRRWIHNLVEAV